MHTLLAHAYHLALHGLHLALRPFWHPLAACLAVAVLGRQAGGARMPVRATLVAGGAVLAGWLIQAPPASWPPVPVARLAGLALIVLAGSVVRAGGVGARGPSLAILTGVGVALAAWWLCGAPVSAIGLAACVATGAGLLVASTLASRLARGDTGWGTLAAGAALASGLAITGAAPHWAAAALLPALAALALAGLPDAMPVLVGMLVVMSATALFASDRGRLVTVDAACLGPLLAWLLMQRLRRLGAGRAALLASCSGVLLVLVARLAVSVF